jgi:hypothetical protein
MKILNTTPTLGINLTQEYLKFLLDTPILGFSETSTKPNYINNTEVLKFEVQDYSQQLPVFAVVLEFFTENGGIY